MKKIVSSLIIIFSILSTSCDREALVSDFDGSSNPATPYYIQIIGSNPASGETNVALNTTIGVLFNDNIDSATINASTFFVNNGSPVSGSYFYDAPSKIAVFTPSTQLTANTTYQITLTTGITNIAGETLQSNQTWSFTTTATGEPEINVTENTYPIFTGNIVDAGNEVVALSKPIFFNIDNSGLSDLIVSNISISGTDISEFGLNMPTLTPIIPGGSLSFSVDFIPASTGVKNVQIIVDSNDSSEPQFIINLKATAVATAAPYILVYKGTLPVLPGDSTSLGSALIGTTTVENSYTILNRGSAALNISSIILSGVDAPLFDLNLTPFASPVSINSSTSFNVSFSPVENGSNKADLLINNDDPGMPIFSYFIKGRGTKK